MIGTCMCVHIYIHTDLKAHVDLNTRLPPLHLLVLLGLLVASQIL